MKAIITPAYTFTPGASGVGTVDLSAISGFDIKRLLAIVNQTNGILIYSTANSLLKYTSVAAGVVTLFKDTTGMNSTDKLQIIYEEIGQKASAGSHSMVLSTEQEAMINDLEANQVLGLGLVGAVNETAPASDTASSGLNGRLQRIAQRITSLMALFPGSLGQKTSANSFAVSLSSEQEALIGSATEGAPATDTASSGLNGRLQRVAQRLTSLIALVPGSLGQKTSANSFAVVIASDNVISAATTQSSVSGNIASAQITVGTGAARATVTGAAPSISRKKLMIKPSGSNTGRIWLGPSTLTINTGLEIVGPDRLEFEFDPSDYYLISDTAGQVVEILEKV